MSPRSASMIGLSSTCELSLLIFLSQILGRGIIAGRTGARDGCTAFRLRSVRGPAVPQHGARATLRLVRAHASRAHHAPPPCPKAFGGGTDDGEIAEGESPTTARSRRSARRSASRRKPRIGGKPGSRIRIAPRTGDSAYSATPATAFVFRSNDKFIMAYGCAANGKYDPLWCWKRKPEGKWTLYRLRASLEGRELGDHAERQLRVGNWD